MERYLKAANRGNSVAYQNIDHLYEFGQSVPQDYSKAIKWFRRQLLKGKRSRRVTLDICIILVWVFPRTKLGRWVGL